MGAGAGSSWSEPAPVPPRPRGRPPGSGRGRGRPPLAGWSPPLAGAPPPPKPPPPPPTVAQLIAAGVLVPGPGRVAVPTGAPPGGPAEAWLTADVTPGGELGMGGVGSFPGPAELLAAVRAAGGLPALADAEAWSSVTFDGIPFLLLRAAWEVVVGGGGGGGQAPAPAPPPQPPPPPPAAAAAAPPRPPHGPPTITVPPPDSPQWVCCSRCRVWRAVPVGAHVSADPASPGLWVCEWAAWDLAAVHPFTGACAVAPAHGWQ